MNDERLKMHGCASAMDISSELVYNYFASTLKHESCAQEECCNWS